MPRLIDVLVSVATLIVTRCAYALRQCLTRRFSRSHVSLCLFSLMLIHAYLHRMQMHLHISTSNRMHAYIMHMQCSLMSHVTCHM